MMRNISGLALILVTFALSGCVSSGLDSLSSLQNGCTTSTSSVSCGPPPTTTTTPPTTPPTAPNGTPIVNTGNTTNITTGDTTIALESSVNTTLVGAAPAISQLIDSPLNHTLAAVTTAVTGAALTSAQVAALNAAGSTATQKAQYQQIIAQLTANQQISFNTNTATNGLWPVPKTMVYSDYDTCINDGLVNPATPGVCGTGAGGTGLGGNYKAYRYYQPGTYDEELQIWSWNNSYATQYRDVTASGTAPQHQAWSFGGNYTTAAAMPTSGTVGYAGQWTATATTANFDPNTGSTTVIDLSGAAATKTISQVVAPSNTWRVNGTSSLTANFGTGTFYGTLHSTNWQGVDSQNGLTNVDPTAGQTYNSTCFTPGGVLTCATNTQVEQNALQNWYNWRQEFMNSDVILNYNKIPDITTSATNTAKPNQVVSTAVMDPNNGWITDSSTNPMFAGFFGPVAGGKPQEVTGTFALRATTTNPNGGNAGINNDRRGTIEMSGIFNGQ